MVLDGNKMDVDQFKKDSNRNNFRCYFILNWQVYFTDPTFIDNLLSIILKLIEIYGLTCYLCTTACTGTAVSATINCNASSTFCVVI